MKKFILTIFVVGIAATVMARYTVVEVRLKGTGLEVKESKGFFIEDGIKSINDKYVKDPGCLKGCLIIDEELEWITFIEISKKSHEQWEAELDTDFDNQNSGYFDARKMNEDTETGFIKGSSKGIESIRLELWNEGVSIHTVLLGTWSETWRDVFDDGEWLENKSREQLRYSACGSGFVSLDGEADAFAKMIRANYNGKASNAMWDAFYEAGGETNEVAGVEAAEEVLNDLINKKAKTDDADYSLPKGI